MDFIVSLIITQNLSFPTHSALRVTIKTSRFILQKHMNTPTVPSYKLIIRKRRLICLAVTIKSLGTWHTFQRDTEKNTQINWNYRVLMSCNSETVQQGNFVPVSYHCSATHKSYRIVVESWKGNQNTPLLCGYFNECLWIACTKTFTTELMNAFGL